MSERAYVPGPRGRGSGPGAFTPDGNSVELYARLPAGAEPDVIATAVPPGASILELGSGSGRVTHMLLKRGYRVVAVDESREMLDRVTGARTVHSSIEELDLDERFDAVLLGSYLINTAEPASSAAMLQCCRRHVAPDGRVLVEREGQDWYDVRRRPDGEGRAGVRMRIASIDRTEPGVCAVRIEYEADGMWWSHSFLSRDVPDEALERMLAAAGLRLTRYLTEDHSWVEAVPV
ncbi:class I SAM-dependent methyltransferase [Streptomyces sp. NPDC003032]